MTHNVFWASLIPRVTSIRLALCTTVRLLACKILTNYDEVGDLCKHPQELTVWPWPIVLEGGDVFVTNDDHHLLSHAEGQRVSKCTHCSLTLNASGHFCPSLCNCVVAQVLTNFDIMIADAALAAAPDADAAAAPDAE